MGEAALALRVRAEYPEALEFLFEPHRYKVLHGGRGGAKSWGIARALIERAIDEPLRVLCLREHQISIQESVHRLLCDQIALLGVGEFFEIQKQGIKSKCGAEFIFAGIASDPAKVKSTEGADIAWVEEAEKVSKVSWDTLIPTIRKEGSEIWVSFNPRLPTDDTYRRFIVDPPAGAVVREMSWRDNPWFPQVLDLDRLDCLSKSKWDYAHIWEGKCSVAGDTFYDPEVLHRIQSDVRAPELVGVLEQVGVEVRFVGRSDGWLEVWQKPVRGKDYVLGGDVAKGKLSGDRHSGHVLLRGAHAEQVSRISNRGHMGADEYARALVLTANWYGGKGTLGIEANGLGLAACIAARDTGYRHLWSEGAEVGWNTTATSRPLMLAGLGEGLRDGTLVVRSEATHYQLGTFVRTNTGRPEAAPGCHDDEVTGLAIAYQMALRAPVPRPEGARSGFAKIREFRP